MHDQREIDHSTQPLLQIVRIFKENLLRIDIETDMNLSMCIDPPYGTLFSRDQCIPVQDRRFGTCHDRIKPKGVYVSIVQDDSCAIPWHDPANMPRNGLPQALRIAL